MNIRSRALALSGAACAAVALAISGCSATGSSSSSSSTITVKGNTLAIYISEPPNFESDTVAQDVVDAEKLAYSQQAGEVKDYHLDLHEVRGSVASDDARAAIEDTTAIAYLGEIDPGYSDQTVGITNALDLLQVSPTDTALELGSSTAAVSGSPSSLYESWSTFGHTFARVVPTSAQEAVFLVKAMQGMGLKSLYVANDGSDYGKSLALAVSSYARSIGLTVSSSESGADAIFYATMSPSEGVKFFDAAASAAPSAKLFGSSSLDSSPFLSSVSSAAAAKLYISTPGFLNSQLNSAAKAFRASFDQTYHHEPTGEALFGYEAMSAVLAVLKEAGSGADSRTLVIKDFLSLKNRSSVLGTYSINSAGNTSLDAFVLDRISDGALVPVKTPSQG